MSDLPIWDEEFYRELNKTWPINQQNQEEDDDEPYC